MSERRCILSGERADPAHLVRLAISPDGEVLPDVRAKAPGRGAWVGVSRTSLEQALKKGRLKGALGRAFKGEAQLFAANLPGRLKERFQFTFHFLGNSLIEIDGNRASHETYFIGYHRFHPEPDGAEKDALFGGRYLSINESRDGGPWLIASRTVVHDWSRVDRLAEIPALSKDFVQGDHVGGHVDPVFHLLNGRAAAE